MGSTRFFKVARAKSDEGLIVVKVFVKNDPSLPMESHADKLEAIKRSLSNAVNCLPFQRVIVSVKYNHFNEMPLPVIPFAGDRQGGFYHPGICEAQFVRPSIDQAIPDNHREEVDHVSSAVRT